MSGLPNFNNISDLTLGTASTRGQTQGKYLGLGTFENTQINPNAFSTKRDVLLDPTWAAALNDLLANSRGNIGQAAAQDPDFSLGLEGAGGAYTSITQYLPDDRARLAISKIDDPSVPPYLLPGSTQQRIARAAGLNIGRVRVKNPQNQTGYLDVGSRGWQDAMARYVNDEFQSSEIDMQHLFGQGAVYGLGPVYQRNGIDVQFTSPLGAGGPVRYYVPGPVQLGNIRVTPISTLIGNTRLMRDISGYYQANLKNPDATRRGIYGGASLLLRHADKMNTTTTGGAANQQGVEQAVLAAFQNGQSLRGIAHWADNYGDSQNRLGLTAFPLRDAQGNAIPQSQAYDPKAGNCNIGGSSVGVSQAARDGGEYNVRGYKQGRKHTSRRKGIQGAKSNNTTFFCGSTPDYVVNPYRKIYQAGGERALENQSLIDVINQYGPAQGLSVQDLSQRYYDWAVGNDTHGTNQYFMLNPAEGRLGFSRAAPLYYEQGMTPQQVQAFRNTDLNLLQKAQQSQEDYQNILASQTTPSIYKGRNATRGSSTARNSSTRR